MAHEKLAGGWGYQIVLQIMLDTGSYSDPVRAAMEIIISKGFDRQAVVSAISSYGVADLTYYKSDFLNLLLGYTNIILDDHALSESEYEAFGLLKLLFKIKEGDFYDNRLHQVKEIINEQMSHIGSDGRIDLTESFTIANLQSMFDLSAEQFFSLWNDPTPSISVSK